MMKPFVFFATLLLTGNFANAQNSLHISRVGHPFAPVSQGI